MGRTDRVAGAGTLTVGPIPSRLAAAIEAELRDARIPGAAIAVAYRAGDAWAGAVGMADLRARKPATADTAYHLWSGTKLYTATAIMQLVENGHVELDAPAAAYLPETFARAPASCRPTIRQLLSHSSGLVETLRAFLSVHPEHARAPTTAEALARFRISCRGRPGGCVAYRNVNYALLGEIVSRAAALPYPDYVRERILRPLGMQAAFTTTPGMRSEAAVGYVGAWEPLRFLTPLLVTGAESGLLGARVDGLIELRPFDLDTVAIGGLIGSVLDFVRFVRAQLADGGGVLSPAGVAAMQTLVAHGAAGIASRVGVGLGWKIGDARGERFLNHEGGGAGFTSETRLYPQAGVGIVLCMNRWIPPARSHLVAHRICERVRRAG